MPIFQNNGNEVVGVVVTQRTLIGGRDDRCELVRNAPLRGRRHQPRRWRSASASASPARLTRRLKRLQRAALRITPGGPGGAVSDRSRPRRGRRPRPRPRPHAGGASAPGDGAAVVRGDGLARAAHAADDAPGHDGAARRGPEREGGDLADALQQVERLAAALRRLSSARDRAARPLAPGRRHPLRNEPVELGEIARAVAAEFSLRAGDRDGSCSRSAPRPVLGKGATWRPAAGGQDPDRQRVALRTAW